MNAITGVEQRVLSNGWQLNVSKHIERMPASMNTDALNLLSAWQRVWAHLFPNETTWVRREYGVPSLFVRLDCVWNEQERRLNIYEIEDRPCGIGACSSLFPEFKKRLDTLRQEWHPFSSVACPERITDDALWLGRELTLSEAQTSEGLLLIRSRPEDERCHGLEQRAVSTVANEGHKGYGERLGLWSIHRYVVDPDEQGGGRLEPAPPPNCCVKPLQGTRSWWVTFSTHGTSHFDSLIISGKEKIGPSQMEKLARTKGGIVCQPIIPPMRRADLPGFNMIWRPFFGYSPRRRRYVPLGGSWMALDRAVVHGTSASISGELAFT